MIAGVVLAAGLSRRMGQPKMLLPWGNATVIGAVLSRLHDADISPIMVVTGGASEAVRAAIQDPLIIVAFNPRFQEDSMVISLQTGLVALPEDVQAALVTLGDQPQLTTRVIRLLVEEYHRTGAALIVPSYQLRRGHPWLIDRCLWDAVLRMTPEETLREFLNRHENEIMYVNTNEVSIMQDLDTPQDYDRYRSQADCQPPGFDQQDDPFDGSKRAG